MGLHINANVPVQLTPEEAMAHLRVGDEFAEEFAESFARCMAIAKPKYIFREAEVSVADDRTIIGGMGFDSRILRINMQGLTRAFASVVTCGRELYDLSRACGNALEQYWIDGISEMLMAKAGSVMRDEIRRITGRSIRAISPGSLGDFPIIEQKKLFALLGDTMGSIGVELTESCLMLPFKTASAFYFESDEEYENCMLCLRKDCLKRRAAFAERVFNVKFGLTEDHVKQKAGK